MRVFDRRGAVSCRCSIVAAFIVLVLITPSAHAQSGQNGSIRGKVIDATGGALPGVTVNASSPSLIRPQLTTTSDADGNYALLDLPIGDTRVRTRY